MSSTENPNTFNQFSGCKITKKLPYKYIRLSIFNKLYQGIAFVITKYNPIFAPRNRKEEQ